MENAALGRGGWYVGICSDASVVAAAEGFGADDEEVGILCCEEGAEVVVAVVDLGLSVM